MQRENITEAVPESAEEAAEEADLSTLVDISILIHARRHTSSQISGENPAYTLIVFTHTHTHGDTTYSLMFCESGLSVRGLGFRNLQRMKN